MTAPPGGIPVRCRHFRDDGRPLQNRPCRGDWRRGISCAWVHPDQPEWDTAHPANIPVKWIEFDDYLESVTRVAEEKSARARGEEYSPPPLEDALGRRRRQSSNASRLSDHQWQPDPGPPFIPPSRQRPLTTQHRSPVASSPPQRQQPVFMDVDLPGTSARHATQASTAVQQSSNAGPQVPAEGENEWLTRSKQMSDYTATRNALLKAEEQLAEFRRLFGDDLDEKRQAQYNKLEQRAIQLRREYKSSSARIGGARLGTAFSPQAGAKYEELCGYISELQVSTKDMHRTLESFQAHWKKTASETDQDDMDVDPSGRPRKRARLDERAQAAQDEKARRLEDLSDRVAQSETRLADLRTLLQGRVDDLIGRVDVTLGEQTSKIVEVFDGQLRVSADGLPEDASPSDETLTLGQRHALLIRELDGMDEDIQSIGNYVAQVKEHIDEQSKEIAALENEVLESSRQAASVREKLEAYEAQQAANKERLANLSERFEQHMARHNIPSPQRTPSPQPELITTHDAAMAALQDSIAQAVRRMLIPVVQGARQDIQGVIEAQKNAVLAEVWPQMQQLLGAVHAIDQRLPQGN